MKTLKKLELTKLIKELDYLESEFNYKSELIKEIDFEFKKEVEGILLNQPDLKELFTKSLDKINHIRQNLNLENSEKIDTDEIVSEEKNNKLKTLYRTIVKSTHPDVSKDERFKELYLEATKAYDDNNLYPIISICNTLKIPFEITDEEYDTLKNQVEMIKKRTNFLETTYSWQWYASQDLNFKNNIVLNFIQSQIF